MLGVVQIASGKTAESEDHYYEWEDEDEGDKTVQGRLHRGWNCFVLA